MHTCIYMGLFQRTTLPARSASRMHEHAAHTSITYCIDFLTHSLFGPVERYYFYSGACAFSWSAGINLEHAEKPKDFSHARLLHTG